MVTHERLGDQFVKFERVVHGFAYDFALKRGSYALFPVKCAGFGRTRDYSVLFSRFLSLSPLRILA